MISDKEREEVAEEFLRKSPGLRARNQQKYDMKKYYKLLLVSVTVLSLLSFIFYKTQYDKLYNVLRVLEFYGVRREDTHNVTKCDYSAIESDYDSRNSDPIPSWQSLDPFFHVYSAYCTGSSCPMVSSVGVAREDKLLNGNVMCKLWLPQSSTGVEGIFSYQKLILNRNSSVNESSSSLVSFVFNCENKYPSRIPNGVTFYSSASSTYVQVGGSDEGPRSDSIAICLAPQKDNSDSTYSLLENILWHNIFGIRNFYIYDRGSSKKFYNNVRLAGLRSHLTILPWNFPSVELEDPEDRLLLLRTDCHFRSVGKFQTFTLLELHQILVPKSTESLVEEFNNFVPKNNKHLDVPRLRFCSEFPEEGSLEFSVMALDINMYYAPMTSNLPLVHQYSPDEIPNEKNFMSNNEPSSQIHRNILAVHDYSPCDKFDIDISHPDTVKDEKVSKAFGTQFQKYIQLFPHKNL